MPSRTSMPRGMHQHRESSPARVVAHSQPPADRSIYSRRPRFAAWLLLALLCTFWPGFAAAAPQAQSEVRVSEDAAAIARNYVGAPYRYGGAGPRSFDCSGLTMFVFGQVGVQLPHNAARQYNTPGMRIGALAELAPGDLVFFVRTTGRRGITHAAIYVGDGHMVSANTPRTGVQLNNIYNAYWSSRFAGGLRVQR